MKHRTSSCQARAAKPELSSYGYANGQRKVPEKLAPNRHQTALRSRSSACFPGSCDDPIVLVKSQPGNKTPVKLTSISDQTGPFSTVPEQRTATVLAMSRPRTADSIPLLRPRCRRGIRGRGRAEG